MIILLRAHIFAIRSAIYKAAAGCDAPRRSVENIPGIFPDGAGFASRYREILKNVKRFGSGSAPGVLFCTTPSLSAGLQNRARLWAADEDKFSLPPAGSAGFAISPANWNLSAFSFSIYDFVMTAVSVRQI